MDKKLHDALISNLERNSMDSFMRLIYLMHMIYELPMHHSPDRSMNLPEQLQNFKTILTDEILEIDDIILNPEHAADIQTKMSAGNIDEVVLDAHVALADLLADVVVYCFSESLKHGIYLPAILHNVMVSNFLKLGEDGQPIKDDTGKFLKGPNYEPPEKAIKDLLPKLWAASSEEKQVRGDNESVH